MPGHTVFWNRKAGTQRRRVFIASCSLGVQLLPGRVGVRVGSCTAGLPGPGAPAQGLSPPKPPHRPDPAARVPRGVDVRVCQGKAENPSAGWRAWKGTGHCPHELGEQGRG